MFPGILLRGKGRCQAGVIGRPFPRAWFPSPGKRAFPFSLISLGSCATTFGWPRFSSQPFRATEPTDESLVSLGSSSLRPPSLPSFDPQTTHLLLSLVDLTTSSSLPWCFFFFILLFPYSINYLLRLDDLIFSLLPPSSTVSRNRPCFALTA